MLQKYPQKLIFYMISLHLMCKVKIPTIFTWNKSVEISILQGLQVYMQSP